MTGYVLLDSGDAEIGRYETVKEAREARRRVYEDMRCFVDTRPLLPISKELPIIKAEDWEDCNE